MHSVCITEGLNFYFKLYYLQINIVDDEIYLNKNHDVCSLLIQKNNVYSFLEINVFTKQNRSVTFIFDYSILMNIEYSGLSRIAYNSDVYHISKNTYHYK